MSNWPWIIDDLPYSDDGPDGDYCLAVEDVHKSFTAGPGVLRGVQVRLHRGEILVVVGESGIGKSVFLKHLVGLEEPTKGRIWYRPSAGSRADRPIHRMAEAQMAPVRRDIGMVFQSSSLFDWMTVHQNVALPLEQHPDVLDHWLGRDGSDALSLLRFLDRVATPPPVFASFAAAISAPRASLAERFQAVTREAGGPAALSLFESLGAPLAKDLGWAPRSGPTLIGGLDAHTVAALVVVSGESPGGPPDTVLRLAEGKHRLDQCWAGLRSSWGRDVSPFVGALCAAAHARGLDALTPPVSLAGRPSTGASQMEEDLSRIVVSVLSSWGVPPSLDRSASRCLVEVLAQVRARPELLGAMLADLPGRPAPFNELVQAHEALAAAQGAAVTAWMSDPGSLASCVCRGLLVTRGLADPGPSLGARLPALLDTWSDRQASLGAALAPSTAGVLGDLSGAGKIFDQALATGRATLHGLPRATLDEAAIDLIVRGLLTVLKLDPDRDRDKLPSELSGGMRTRVGLARSLAIQPSVVLYDEPTAGLDPVLSKNIARQILELQTSGVVATSVVVTHDKDLYATLKLAGNTRLLYLSEGRFLDPAACPVWDRLREGDSKSDATAVTTPGPRGYPPHVFLDEFEAKTSQSGSSEIARE